MNPHLMEISSSDVSDQEAPSTTNTSVSSVMIPLVLSLYIADAYLIGFHTDYSRYSSQDYPRDLQCQRIIATKETAI